MSAPPPLHPDSQRQQAFARIASDEEMQQDTTSLQPLNDTAAAKKTRTYQSPSSQMHIKTYTAGEDTGRLADMAKEFGLQHSRNPRRQVRRTRSFRKKVPEVVINLLLDETFQDLRMRAIYSAHDHEETDDAVMLDRWNASWADLDEYEEGRAGGAAEEDPHAAGLGGNLTSAVLGIIKGMVGPAILYLPHGFAASGWVISLPIMAISTVMYLHSSKCLLDSWKIQTEVDNGSPANSNGTASSGGSAEERMPLRTDADAGSTASSISQPLQMSGHRRKRHVLLSYPELAYRALGTTGETLVKTGIALMQSGVCLTYLIFVPQNLHTSVLTLCNLNISPSLWLILMIGIQIPLSWIRDIRKFTITNLVANGLILYGLLTCLGFALHSESSSSLIGRWKSLKPFAPTWFLFIGTSVLMFEGSITLLVPLQEAVHKPDDRKSFPKVYRRVIIGIICFYAFFGITCWMSFGDGVKTVLTTSLPSGVLATTVQLAYSVAVIFTFPLQNFPALEIACRSIAKRLQGQCGVDRKSWYLRRNVISSVLVCFLALIAVSTMDSLDKVVSLMGSLLGCPIAFVFPPLIHTRLDPNATPSRKQFNLIVAGLGFGSMIMASIITILEW